MLRNMGVLKHAAILAGIVLTVGATTLPPSVGWAQSTLGNPMVTGNIIRDFARITFYWPEKIDMSATTSGKKLVVRFDRRVNPDFGEILRSMYPYVMKAELTGNQRTIIFTMKEAYNIRSFITDSESGVDILGIYDPAPAQQTATVASTPPPAPQPARATTPPPPPEPVVTPPPPRAKPTNIPPRQATNSSRAVPVVDVQQVEVTPPAPQPPKPQPEPKHPPEPTPPPPTPAPASVEQAVPQPTPAPKTVTRDTAPPVEAKALTLPQATMKAIEDFGAVSGEKVAITHSVENKRSNLRFDFKERVAAASWQRGRTYMLLFAKPVTLIGLDAAKAEGSAWMTDIRQLGGKDFTLLQIDLNADVRLKTLKDREGYGWNARVFTRQTRPETTIPAEAKSVNGESHVFMPTTQSADIITIRDPIIGDILSVVPLYASSNGVFPPRGFIDFDLLKTTQGIVVSSKSDLLQVARQKNGVRISAQGGLFITEGISNAAIEGAAIMDARDEMFKSTLFPYADWKVDGLAAYHEREAYLLNRIVEAKNEAARNQHRLELAQLYFSQNMYNESNAVLNRIRREDLDFYRENKLAAQEGAGYLLNYRLPEAALSLSSDTLDGTQEGELLRKATSAVMGGDDEVPYLQYNSSYIRQYPPALRQRLAIIAANQAIRKNDLRSPSEIFETLEDDKLSGEVADYVDYLKAKIAADSGRATDAEKIWKRLAAKLDDRQFRARSEYSLVLLGLEEGTLSPEEAIKRLDKLRIVWRGDDLERALLMVLGQLQINQGNYWEGMKAWEELLQYYPNSPDAIKAYQRLAETFRELYLHDSADKMDPVKALALYSEFQELTPLGEDGNTMIQNLVDRLVAIDLLDQGAARLENQIQYRLEGEEKSRVGARLAVIYLLNREPAKALSALQNSRVDDVPAGLSLERNRIAAQALIDLDRTDQALTMIEGDFSTDGENVRLEAYWEKEDWAYVIDIIELMMRKRTDLNAPFTAREGQRLLQLALAYIFVGEFEQLQYVRDAYAPLMEGNPYKDEFLFLTEERIQTSSENFGTVIDNIGSMESFMDGYRDRLKKGELSDAVGNSDNSVSGAKPPANPQ